MSILAFVITDMERHLIRTHNEGYEKTPPEGRYEYIKACIDSLSPFELLEYTVKYQQFQEKMTPITIEAWTAIVQMHGAMNLLNGPKDENTKRLLKAFRDLLNSLILD